LGKRHQEGRSDTNEVLTKIGYQELWFPAKKIPRGEDTTFEKDIKGTEVIREF